jgi:hypothetical protein
MKAGVSKSAPPIARQRHLLIALGLCLLTLAAYSNSFTAGFAMDNRGLILEDTRIRAATPENLALIVDHTYWWPYGESGLYRPLTTLSYLFNYSILGDTNSPAGYHWINFFLHAGNVLLVYALSLRLAGDRWRAASVAALWAVHPLLTESVTNIVGRADLLAGLGILGGFLLYVKSTESTGARRWLWLAALSAATAAGVFAKESAVTLLGVVALYEAVWWKERRKGRGLLFGAVAILIPIQLMLFQRAAVLTSSQPSNLPFYDNPITGAGWFLGRVTALTVIGKYAGLLIWPAALSSDYSWAQVPLGIAPSAGWLVLLGLIALVRRNRTAIFLACAAFLVFLPTSNLLFPIGTIMAERFLYLPSIAFAAALVTAAYTVSTYVRPTWIVPAALGILLTAYAARTWARNLDWQSDLTLSAATVAVSPDSYKSHLALANSLFDADPGPANIDRVLSEAEKSLAILQPLPPERNNAGALRRVAVWYLAKADLAGQPAGAPACRRAIELMERCRAIILAQIKAARQRHGFDPNTDPLATAPAEIDRMISAAYLKLGDTGRSLDISAAAIESDPSNPELYRQYAQALLTAGRSRQAIAVLMEGVMLTMDPGLRQNVVQVYQAAGDGAGCALMPGQNGSVALNPRCEVVHTQLCDATLAAIQLRLKAGRRDLADQLKRSGVNDFACSAAPLDAALGVR